MVGWFFVSGFLDRTHSCTGVGRSVARYAADAQVKDVSSQYYCLARDDRELEGESDL